MYRVARPKDGRETHPVLEYLNRRARCGDIVYVHFACVDAYNYYGRLYGWPRLPTEYRFIRKTTDKGITFVKGSNCWSHWLDYLPELDSFRGQKRFWLFYSLRWSFRGVDEKMLMIEHLKRRGRPLDAMEALVDDEQRSAGPKAPLSEHRAPKQGFIF